MTLESILGQDLTIEQITSVDQPPANSTLSFDIEIDGIDYPAALTSQGTLFRTLKGVVEQNSAPEELKVSPTLTVHSGPVVVPSKKAYTTKVGETIDCGVAPNQNITGILMRSNGRYWPIQIDDESVRISGELSKPVNFSNTPNDRVYATFVIGTIELTAFQRRQIQIGTNIPVSRFSDNRTDVYFQNKPYAKGHLKIANENLAVEIDQIDQSPTHGK